MEIKGTEMDSIEKYLELSRTCPELFAQSEELPLVLDPKELYAFAQKSGRRIGIVYESHYHLMVVDVVRAKNGSLFAYERLMNRVMRGAVVIVPYYNGKYILLRQYRHALREYQYGFPRGFGEEGISAKENAGTLTAEMTFLQMDAEALTLADGTFDVLVTRNLTWNLRHPEKAYVQWARVLKPGGLLLNFDANWYSYLYDEEARKGHLLDRENIARSDVGDETEGTDVPAMEAIALQTPLSAKRRPDWDMDVLSGLGMQVLADTEVWKRVWTREERINNASTPMFLVEARKCGHPNA